jgi:hypothetical protein
MNLLERIDRMHRIHKLIQHEATGTPSEFAKKLHLSRGHLYFILDEFKDYGAIIKFNRKRGTFVFCNDFDENKLPFISKR